MRPARGLGIIPAPMLGTKFQQWKQSIYCLLWRKMFELAISLKHVGGRTKCCDTLQVMALPTTTIITVMDSSRALTFSCLILSFVWSTVIEDFDLQAIWRNTDATRQGQSCIPCRFGSFLSTFCTTIPHQSTSQNHPKIQPQHLDLGQDPR